MCVYISLLMSAPTPRLTFEAHFEQTIIVTSDGYEILTGDDNRE